MHGSRPAESECAQMEMLPGFATTSGFSFDSIHIPPAITYPENRYSGSAFGRFKRPNVSSISGESPPPLSASEVD